VTPAEPASTTPDASGLPPAANSVRITHEPRPLAGYYNRQLVHLLRSTAVDGDRS
jgi:hypothetical protein